MNIQHLSRIDMNLLLTLQVLLDAGSVSVTAERLYLTQPAISKSLSRLRELFQDPLFTRSGRGLVATPFARRLQPALNRIFSDVADLFLVEKFVPATYIGEFNLAVNEFMDMALVPLLVAQLAKEAPGMYINTLTQMDNQLVALEKGDLDFVLSLRFAHLTTAYSADMLLRDKSVIFARRNHPLARNRKLSAANVAHYPRVLLHLPDMAQLSGIRGSREARLLAQWEVALETENLMTALATVARTDYLLHAPGLLQLYAAGQHETIVLDTDPLSSATMEYCLVTHERVRSSAPHQWLRQRIMALAKGLAL